MDETSECAQMRPLLPELATGATTGHERARVLRHVAECEVCRRELAELSRVADDLLSLAPEHEPPPGFDSAVAARIRTAGFAPHPQRQTVVARVARHVWHAVRRSARRTYPRKPARVLLAAAVLVLVAALGAAVALWRTAPDRTTAARYRETLQTANGQYLRTVRVTTEAGTQAGAVFLYQGAPSWLLVSLPGAPANGQYAITITTRDGWRYPAGVCTVGPGSTTAGYELSTPVFAIARIDMEGPGGVRLAASLP